MQRNSLQFQDQMVRPVFQQGDARIVQLSLQKGQGLFKHEARQTLNLVVLDGRIEFSEPGTGETAQLGATDMITVPPQREHEVRALETSTALLIFMPEVAAAKPSLGDHVTVYSQPDLLDQIDPSLHSLVADHVDLCKLLENASEPWDEEKVQRVLDAVKGELEEHFVFEERIVFPRLAPYVGGADVGPVARLLEEHANLRKQYADCAAMQHSGAPVLGDHLNQLRSTLLNHLGKEDSHIFPMATRLLSPEDKRAIAEELGAHDATQ